VATAFDALESPSLPKNLNRSLVAVNRDILKDINVTLALVPLLFGDENTTRQVTPFHNFAPPDASAHRCTRRQLFSFAIAQKRGDVASISIAAFRLACLCVACTMQDIFHRLTNTRLVTGSENLL
jgi:hypothetical protein